MQGIALTDLPNTVRVKLDKKGERRLWDAVTDCGGITAVAEQYGYERTMLYNWKHKSTYLPAPFISELLGDASKYVVALKGGGRSPPIEQPVLPLPVDDELLTRVAHSVYVNKDGVPTYQVNDVGLVNRFVELLEQYGDVPVSLYHRSVYELRYPKYLHDIFQCMTFTDDIAAVVDEQGSIEDGQVVVGDRSIPVQEFDRQLYHRGKQLQLALARGDTATITRLMASEAEKVQQLLRE